MRGLRGVFGPVTSPFDGRGELARSSFEANVRSHLAEGLSGVVIAGSTGEAALLDESERNALVEWARPIVSREQWLIVGTGAESTRVCLQRCRSAAERGADAVLVVAPHYYTAAMTAAALRQHYLRVADESPLPVILYNIPKYAHFALPAPIVAELARHENVIGIKDSSGDLAMLGGYLESQDAGFAVLTGSGQTFAPALEQGAQGGILAIALFAGPMAVGLFGAHEAGDIHDVRRLQDLLTTPAARIVGALGVPGVKAALDAVGFAGGPVRSPLLPLDASHREEVEALMERARSAHAA